MYAYAVWKIKQVNPKAVILVVPSDSYIPDVNAFANDVKTGLQFVAKNDSIMTIGIATTKPETGYGYIESSKQPLDTVNEIYPVISYREKPDLEKAIEYLKNGHFLWNAGMFMATTTTFENAYRKHLPKMAEAFDTGNAFYNTNDQRDFINSMFPSCQKISGDYGIMEKSANIVLKSANFRWSDVGAWNAVHELQAKNINNNSDLYILTNVKSVLENVSNCMISLPDNTSAVIEGVRDLIVVLSENRLLICKKDNEQRIKDLVLNL